MKTATLVIGILLVSVGISNGQNIMAEHHLESTVFDQVTIYGLFCDVNVTKGDRLVFDGVIEGSGDKNAFKIYSIEDGDEVIFKVDKLKILNNDIWNRIRKSEINVSLPRGVTLNIVTSSGDINVDGLSGPEHRIEASSGDITLDRVEGDLKVVSSSGDIVIHNSVGQLESQSSSGDQRYEDVRGDLSARAASGDIKIHSVLGNVYAKSSSGDINIETTEGHLVVESNSGDIEGTEILLTGDSRSKSNSGDIELIFVNGLDDIVFDLKSSSGTLKIGKNMKGEGELVHNSGGSILFSGVSISGDQTYGN